MLQRIWPCVGDCAILWQEISAEASSLGKATSALAPARAMEAVEIVRLGTQVLLASGLRLCCVSVLFPRAFLWQLDAARVLHRASRCVELLQLYREDVSPHVNASTQHIATIRCTFAMP